MTAQIYECLYYNGRKLKMAYLPLEMYLDQLEEKPDFFSPSTANLNGYIGTWEIKYNKLYLIEIEAHIRGKGIVGIDYFFPNQKEVFASWFTGEVRIPEGKELLYVHMGYGSIYEEDIFLKFKNGILENTRIGNNKKLL
jgi:hypothetical protein